MFRPKYLFIAAACLSGNIYAGEQTTYRGLYDCSFAKAQFQIAHDKIDTHFSLLLKWPNGTEQLLTSFEQELGCIGNDIGALYWTTKDAAFGEMTFRTDLPGAAPDEIAVFVQDQWHTCRLIKRETTKG